MCVEDSWIFVVPSGVFLLEELFCTAKLVLMLVRLKTSPNSKKTAVHAQQRAGIEESFRLTKHDLKAHPIYQYKSSRIRALSEAEFSLFTHTESKELYVMPSSLSPLTKNLYRIAGLKPSTASYKI